MKNQNYTNHKFYYTPHHLIFYPIILLLNILIIYYLINQNANTTLWLIQLITVNTLCFLALMLRQHYALGNQNRIIRLEMRLRYYILCNKRFETIEEKLSLSQIFALRFASDDELLELIELTLKNNLSAKEIKQKIKNWLPDHMRV